MRVLVALFVTCSASESFLTSWMKLIQRKEECYPDLGCFSLKPPWFSWSRPIPVLPQARDVIDTQFYLVTRNHPDNPVLMPTKPIVNLTGSDYDGSKWNFFLVHGFIGHITDPWIQTLTAELLQLFDGNVILVDWEKGANMFNYVQAVANTRLVGAEMSRLTELLISECGADPAKTHLFGYSLGAQVISYVSAKVGKVQRITAFDPAQPGFEGADKLVRLDQTDAEFVDVIHTNSRRYVGFGVRESVGHADFFVNGGETQPGCRKLKIGGKNRSTEYEIFQHVQHYLDNHGTSEEESNSSLGSSNLLSTESESNAKSQEHDVDPTLLGFLTGKIASLIEYVVCSHQRAPQYYTESLRFRNCSYWGRSWEPYTLPDPLETCQPEFCSEMGLHSILFPARGNFYVYTNENPPYCKWQPGIEAPMKNYLADRYLRQMFMNTSTEVDNLLG